MKRISILTLAVCLCSLVKAFYVPGMAPVEFKLGEEVDVKAVKMTSTMTQLPYEYYSLPFCRPKKGAIIYKSENLGEVLRGDRIVNTPYEVLMKQNQSCRLLCNSPKSPLNWSVEDSKLVANRIQHQYYVHLLVDNLPSATIVDRYDRHPKFKYGYRLGFVEKGVPYINNHLKMILKYHTQPDKSHRVVGFEVEAMSIDHSVFKFSGSTCSWPKSSKRVAEIIEGALDYLKGKSTPEPYRQQAVNIQGSTKLYFTYEVVWKESNIRWASRWDLYLSSPNATSHWVSVMNISLVIFFLFGILSIVIVKLVLRDIVRYNRDDKDDSIKETGWKLVHGDVFRPPSHPKLFTAVIGSGIQIFLVTFITIFFAMLGMLSPASRGGLMTAAIFLYVFMGFVSGYFSGKLYKTLRGIQWKKAALGVGIFYPSLVFGCGFVLNFFIWGKHSSGAVPFTTMLALLCLWFGISLPLVFLGFYYGIRKHPHQNPVRTNQVAREIPRQVWYMNPIFYTSVAGVVPFTPIYLELYYIFQAIWGNEIYYLFGFLFISLIVLVVACSQLSILTVYWQLRKEDYHWWWRSIFVSGGSALYVFGFSVVYFFTELEITEFIPILLYFGYTGLIVITVWILTGTIGFYAAYFFITGIYNAIKIE